MTRRRGFGLRTRLTAAAVIAAALFLVILVAAFNLVLDARLRSDADNVLRERATTVLRGLATTDGRLSLPEAPDQGTVDAQTWIFAGNRVLEQPAGVSPRDGVLVAQLARTTGSVFATDDARDTRLYATPVRQAGAQLGAVVVTASLGPYERSASTALGASVLLGLLTLVAIAGLARWLINRALRPVSEMTTKAADWDERDLSRRFFAGEPRDELSTLASVFDRLLARLAQSLRREQRLTAEVSHELRTPLAKILAEAELAASRERDPQDYRVSLRSITNYAQALQRVLETLLASARAAAPASATDSNPLLVARRVAASLQETLTARGKSIDVVGTSRARAAVDADVLERILAPLLENAARHAERHISLEVRTEGDVAIIEIADDGSGVARADRERIFDPGVRGHASADSAHAGAGLGLALARRLARAAGGDVEARAQSGGGRFVTSLPLSR